MRTSWGTTVSVSHYCLEQDLAAAPTAPAITLLRSQWGKGQRLPFLVWGCRQWLGYMAKHTHQSQLRETDLVFTPRGSEPRTMTCHRGYSRGEHDMHCCMATYTMIALCWKPEGIMAALVCSPSLQCCHVDLGITYCRVFLCWYYSWHIQCLVQFLIAAIWTRPVHAHSIVHVNHAHTSLCTLHFVETSVVCTWLSMLRKFTSSWDSGRPPPTPSSCNSLFIVTRSPVSSSWVLTVSSKSLY